VKGELPLVDEPELPSPTPELAMSSGPAPIAHPRTCAHSFPRRELGAPFFKNSCDNGAWFEAKTFAPRMYLHSIY
jgi:hypothetical protein